MLATSVMFRFDRADGLVGDTNDGCSTQLYQPRSISFPTILTKHWVGSGLPDVVFNRKKWLVNSLLNGDHNRGIDPRGFEKKQVKREHPDLIHTQLQWLGVINFWLPLSIRYAFKF